MGKVESEVENLRRFPYNISAMNQEQFKKEEEEVLDKIKSSSYFKKAKELSGKISEDEELVRLAKKRDDAYLMAATTEDESLKHEKEIEAKRANDALLSSDIVKEYMENYKTIKDILNRINRGILEELKYD